MPASFPDDIWNGTSRERPNFSVTREPAGYDYNRISEEVIAIQRYLTSQVGIPIFLTQYIQVNERFGEVKAQGGLSPLATGQALANGSPINVTKNATRVFIVLNAGTVTSGTLTVTGEKVDRNTGAKTPGFQEHITVAGLTTDNTTTTTLGTNKYSFTRAYMTEEWFKGSVSLSTSDLNLSDVDVYSISYEEHSDLTHLEFDILDISAIPTNTSAALDTLLYKVQWSPTTKQTNIINLGLIELPASDVHAADQFIRIRRSLDPTIAHIDYEDREGWFANIGFYPLSQTYWEDITLKVWGRLFFPLRLQT